MAEAPGLGILLFQGGYESAHAAFLLAVGAAALGRTVTLFATGAGVLALARDWSCLADADRDAPRRLRGAPGLDELREAAVALGIPLSACPSGLLATALTEPDLMTGAEEGSLPSFLEATRSAQLISF